MFSLSALRGASLPSPQRLSTGIPQLDAVLGGGCAYGQIVEISGAPGSGRSSLALSLCLRSLTQGGPVAWIESRPAFWPLPSLEAGVPLERLLLLRAPPEDRLRAAEILLASAGAVAVVVVDLEGGEKLQKRLPRKPSRKPNRISGPREVLSHQIVKLHRLAERSSTLLLLLSDRAAGDDSLGLLVDVRLHLHCVPPVSAPPSVFERRLEIEVLRHKQGPTQRRLSEVLHGPDRLRIRSTL